MIRELARRLAELARRLRLRSSRQPDRRWTYHTSRTEVDEAIATVRPFTMLSRHRLESLYDQARHLETAGIPGSLVECGAWRGGAAGLVALANLKYGDRRRRLHLFDSFEGIPEPDEEVDGGRAIAEARRAGVGTGGRVIANPQFYEELGRGYGELERCRHLLEELIGYDPAYIEYHEGFFQDTVPSAADRIGEIALLHLDGDWYASTKTCMDHLYDSVVSGGLVVIDDYGAYDGCRKAVDEFLADRGLSVYLFQVDEEVRAFPKP